MKKRQHIHHEFSKIEITHEPSAIVCVTCRGLCSISFSHAGAICIEDNGSIGAFGMT